MHETTVKCFACLLVKRVIVVRWPQVYNFTGETCNRFALASGVQLYW